MAADGSSQLIIQLRATVPGPFNGVLTPPGATGGALSAANFVGVARLFASSRIEKYSGSTGAILLSCVG